MVELRLYKNGKLVERLELELDEAFQHLQKDIPVELRHGTSCLTSGVRLVPLVVDGAESFLFLYSNGHHQVINREEVWKITQVLDRPSKKPRRRRQ